MIGLFQQRVRVLIVFRTVYESVGLNHETCSLYTASIDSTIFSYLSSERTGTFEL